MAVNTRVRISHRKPKFVMVSTMTATVKPTKTWKTTATSPMKVVVPPAILAMLHKSACIKSCFIHRMMKIGSSYVGWSLTRIFVICVMWWMGLLRPNLIAPLFPYWMFRQTSTWPFRSARTSVPHQPRPMTTPLSLPVQRLQRKKKALAERMYIRLQHDWQTESIDTLTCTLLLLYRESFGYSDEQLANELIGLGFEGNKLGCGFQIGVTTLLTSAPRTTPKLANLLR